jgi:hypothetical protein
MQTRLTNRCLNQPFTSEGAFPRTTYQKPQTSISQNYNYICRNMVRSLQLAVPKSDHCRVFPVCRIKHVTSHFLRQHGFVVDSVIMHSLWNYPEFH